jgi:nicotinamide mononucleotide transporter
VIAIVFTGLSYWMGLQFGWVKSLDWLEVFAVFTSYSCTWLCVVERRINYPIGSVSSAAYAILFWKQGLIASAVLNIYLVPALAYGWFRWNRDTVTRPVTYVKLRHWPIYAVLAGIGYYGAVLLNHSLKGTMAWSDGVILAGSILAQFLLDNKKLENWIIWAVIDIIAIWEYFTTGLPLVGAQYILFLANTAYGFYTWKKGQNATNVCVDDCNAPYNWALATHPIC